MRQVREKTGPPRQRLPCSPSAEAALQPPTWRFESLPTQEPSFFGNMFFEFKHKLVYYIGVRSMRAVTSKHSYCCVPLQRRQLHAVAVSYRARGYRTCGGTHCPAPPATGRRQPGARPRDSVTMSVGVHQAATPRERTSCVLAGGKTCARGSAGPEDEAGGAPDATARSYSGRRPRPAQRPSAPAPRQLPQGVAPPAQRPPRMPLRLSGRRVRPRSRSTFLSRVFKKNM